MERIICDHVEGLFPKIYCDEFHTLILTPDGKLYYLGLNYHQCFSKQIPERCLEPMLIAENIKSAALGFMNIVAVTDEGEVIVIGEGNLKQHFKGFSHAQRVISEKHDIFWIEDDQGQWYVFGDNRSLQIEDEHKEVLYTFHDDHFPITYKSNTYDFKGDHYGHQQVYPIEQYKEKEPYQRLLKLHGDEVLELKFVSIVGHNIQDTYREMSLLGKRMPSDVYKEGVYDIEVLMNNRWIYTPIKTEVLPEKELRSWIHYDINSRKLSCKSSSVDKTKSTLNGYAHYFLTVNEEGDLLYQKEAKKPRLISQGFLYAFKMDQQVVLIKRNGKAYIGEFSDLLSLYKEVQL